MKVFHHHFKTLEVYPRVHYFQTRYKDVLGRVKRLKDALPGCFKKNQLAEDIDGINSKFEKGLQITVFGNEDLEEGYIVAVPQKTVTVTERSITPGITVHILDYPGEKIDIISLQEHVKDMNEESQGMTAAECIILIRSSENQGILDKEAKDLVKKTFAGRKMTVAHGFDMLKNKISDILEGMVISGMVQMSHFLQQYEPVGKPYFFDCDDDVLNSEQIEISLRGYLKRDSVFKESIEMSKENVLNSKGTVSHVTMKDKDPSDKQIVIDSSIHMVCEGLAKVMKCSSVSVFSTKFDLPVWMCNTLLCHVKFESAVIKSISKNTRYHLGKKCEQVLMSPKPRSCQFVLHMLKEDAKNVFKEMDAKFLELQKVSVLAKRMRFEVGSYLKQSNTLEAQKEVHDQKEFPTIGAKLRSDLLRIDGVYGLGTFYGGLEIHIDKEALKSMTEMKQSENGKNLSELEKNDNQTEDLADTDYNNERNMSANSSAESMKSKKNKNTDRKAEKDDNEILKTKILFQRKKNIKCEKVENTDRNKEKYVRELLKTDILLQMKKNNYFFPYKVNYVWKKPVLFCIRPGNKLSCLGKIKEKAVRRIGTLGAFVKFGDGLHGLTCAHVFGSEGDVYLEGTEPLKLLGVAQKIHHVGTGDRPLIDIAIFKLCDEVAREVGSSLDSNPNIKQVNISDPVPTNKTQSPVHKFGAVTGFTRGTVLSEDYSVVNCDDTYITLVDSKPVFVEDFSRIFHPLSGQDTSTEPYETSNAVLVETQTSRSSPDYAFGHPLTEHNLQSVKNLHPSVILEPGSKISPKNSQSDSKKSGDSNSENLDVKQLLKTVEKVGDFVYVRNLASLSDDDRKGQTKFAEQGDSGSVICEETPPNLNQSVENYTARAMLLGGELDIQGTEYSLAFSLASGIAALD